MTLTVNFIETDRNEAIENFIASLIYKSFLNDNNIKEIIVNLTVQSDHRVPWKSSIHIIGKHEKVMGESQAANYLTAFSQALNRVKRNWENNPRLRA